MRTFGSPSDSTGIDISLGRLGWYNVKDAIVQNERTCFYFIRGTLQSEYVISMNDYKLLKFCRRTFWNRVSLKEARYE